MRYLVMAFRSLLKKGRNNGIKILSLAVGLAMGLVLISKVLFEFTYDDFFPDKERIYTINSNVVSNDDPPRDFGTVSGGVAPGMKREIPEVEAATRYTHVGYLDFKTTDNYKYHGHFILADSCFFDVLPRPVLVGNVKDVLSRPMYAMVSEKLANKIGGVEQAMGKTFEMNIYPGKYLTIGGVFKELPENTHLVYDVIVSLNSISNFSYDGSNGWLGNDRYLGYVKLYPGVDPGSLVPALRKMQEKYQSMESLKEAGIELWYTLSPLTGLHSGIPEVKRMALLMGLLACALIFTAIMNYILIVLSSLVTRTKEMAVYRSYGAEGKEIMKIMMTETALHLFFALFLSAILILVFQGKVREIIGVSLGALFTLRTFFLISVICLVVFLISAIIPSLLYARIPVAAAFRNYKESRRNWKLGSLFMQFVATTFLVVLLVVIWKQYNMMVYDNPGYQIENILYTSARGISTEQKQMVLSEIESLAIVESVATSSTLPIFGFSGNNVRLPGDSRELFNIADQYYVDRNYLSLMEIPVVEGSGFTDDMPENSCIVDRNFMEKMANVADWTDGVVGKEIHITEHGLVHICGVSENIRLGSIISEDFRPSVVFYRKTQAENNVLLVKLKEMSPENISIINSTFDKLLPGKDVQMKVLKHEFVNLYNSSKLFRDSVIIGGIVVLLISFIGLIGYLYDEINRRKSEIAIRKINGGTINDIIALFIKDILYITIPSLIFGCMIAYFAAVKWQEGFSEKATLPFILFLLCAVLVLTLIVSVVITSSYKKAQENPVDSLRSE